ncbi:MAG: cupredoxin domain-containing protein [Myxococcota bacterium]
MRKKTIAIIAVPLLALVSVATQGEPLTLEFIRTSDDTCAKDVAFPELGIEKDLPLNQPVAIQVPTTKSGKLTFQCGMGMYESSVVIN